MAISTISVLKGLFKRSKTLTVQQIRELIAEQKWEEAEAALLHLEIPAGATVDTAKSLPLCIQGEIRFGQQRDDEALSLFQEAARLSPALPDAHYGLSLVYAERGDLQAATKHASFAANKVRDEARFPAQLGYCQLRLGNLQAAEPHLLAAIRLAPNNPFASCNLGIVKATMGDLHGARDCFNNALRLKPDYALARSHLDRIAQAASVAKADELPTAPALPVADGSPDELEARLLVEPSNHELGVSLYTAYKKLGDPQSGIEALEAAYGKSEQSFASLMSLGFAYLDTGRFDSAEQHIRKALERQPDDLEAMKLLTSALVKQSKSEEAAALYRTILDQTPESIPHWVGLASTLTNLCQYDEALSICETYIDKAPILAGCYGAALSYLGRLEEAQQQFSKAIKIQPNDPNLRMMSGAIALYQEDFDKGWEHYSFRTLANHTQMRVLPFPEWKGEDLENKAIIILAEQGLGDQVMFASCLPDLLALKPARVVVEVIDRIAETLIRSFPECEFIATKQNRAIDWVKACPNADFFVHMGDLPMHFRRQASAFPEHQAYLLPAPDKVNRWLQTTNAATQGRTEKLRIGLSWRGGTATTRAVVRTLNVADLVPMLASADANWVCLQYGEVGDDLAKLDALGHPLLYWPESISDLDEFSALIGSLDLVISACNTTVHYAGAMGKPVWVMSPMVPEWRYGLSRKHMLWYPSSTMFRQAQHGDWASVICAIAARLPTFSPTSTAGESAT
jgi:tetratricopeptide (TPR) repeat protein